MANKARVRVEQKIYSNNPSYDEKGAAFKRMLLAFKKQCKETGVQRTARQYQAFESKSRKRRRKRRESELQRLKVKLSENFTY